MNKKIENRLSTVTGDRRPLTADLLVAVGLPSSVVGLFWEVA